MADGGWRGVQRALLFFAQAASGNKSSEWGEEGLHREVGVTRQKVRKGEALRGGGAHSSEFYTCRGHVSNTPKEAAQIGPMENMSHL